MQNSKQVNATTSTRTTSYYYYVIVAGTFLTMLLTFGTIYTYGVFLRPMLDELGWTVAMTSGAYSLGIFVRGSLSFITGRLTDRIGPRIVNTVCALFLGAGYLLMTQVKAGWQLFLFYGVIIAIGQGNYVPTSSTVARWFSKRRGMAIGIMAAGSGIGTMVLAPLARWLIATYDWRTSFAVIGVVSMVLLVIIAQFLRRDPAKMGLKPYGEDDIDTSLNKPLSWPAGGMTYQQAIRTPQLWMTCFIFFTFMFTIQTVLVHLVNHALTLEISAANAATVLASLAAIAVVGKVTLGVVSDRIGTRRAIAVGLVLLLSASLLILVARQLWLLYIVAALFGLGWGMGSLISPLVAELFGGLALGAIVGIADFTTNMGGTVGPVLGGRIFDVAGNYQPIFVICAALLSVSIIIVLFFLKPLPKTPG